MRRFGFCMLALASAASLTPPARAVITGTTLLRNVGVSTTFVADPTDSDRFLIAGRSGTISSYDVGTGSFTTYLTISGVNTSGEGGLLGIALDPDYAANGRGYAYYTSSGSGGSALTSRFVRFQRDPDNPNQALATSITPILSIAQPQDNHNGGWIGFSPNDGLLYLALGDGGGSNDTGTGHTTGTGNALDLTNNLLGKILRIDPDGDDFPTDSNRNYAVPPTNPFVGVVGDDEIWAYGVRNPFRNSFDRQTGDLWIADVGQGFLEEINRQPGASAGGENYGWRLREGTVATPSGGVGGAKPPGAVDPIYEYFHTNNPSANPALTGNSVTGGFVYRGPDASLNGDYFFADFVSDRYWKFDPANPAGTVTNITSQLFPAGGGGDPVSFGEDPAGNLYILTIGGNFFRVETTPPGDFNGDGLVNNADFTAWRAAYGGTAAGADGNGDGVIDAADYTVWRDAVAAPTASVPEPAAASLVIAALLGARRRVAVA